MDDAVSDLWTPAEILEKALEKEHDAKAFYEQMLLHNRHSELLRDVLEPLANEEAKHAKLIEEKLASLRMGKA